MRSASDAAEPRDLPRELLPDLARLRSAIASSGARAGTLLTPRTDSLFVRYGRLVHDAAASLSLVAKGDREAVFTRHILDSLNPIVLFSDPPRTALDIGSGAGFPGVPLAIVWPETRVTLLESRERKAGFLERAARELGLPNVSVVCARLEDLRPGGSVAAAESVFVRAVGDLPRLLGRAATVATPGARWVYFLGSGTDETGLLAALQPLPRGGSMAASSARVAPSVEVATGLFGGRLLTGRFPA